MLEGRGGLLNVCFVFHVKRYRGWSHAFSSSVLGFEFTFSVRFSFRGSKFELCVLCSLFRVVFCVSCISEGAATTCWSCPERLST